MGIALSRLWTYCCPLKTARLWGDLADALVLNRRVSSDRAQHLLNWTPVAPSVLADLTSGDDRLMAIAAIACAKL